TATQWASNRTCCSPRSWRTSGTSPPPKRAMRWACAAGKARTTAAPPRAFSAKGTRSSERSPHTAQRECPLTFELTRRARNWRKACPGRLRCKAQAAGMHNHDFRERDRRMGSYKVTDGVVELGNIKLPLPDTV